MSDTGRKMKNRQLFLKRDAKLKERVKRDYIDNGIATLPCKVSGMDDIISRYSVKGYETLSSEFTEYIESTASFIPADYPLVLEISGCKFTKEEQEVIKSTIHEDYIYELGAVQHYNWTQLIITALMLIGTIISGWFVFSLKGNLTSEAHEIIYIFFWFFADTVVGYFFLDRFEHRKKRMLAGRLADMSVYFTEKHDDSDYTEDEVKAVYNELERVTYSDK